MSYETHNTESAATPRGIMPTPFHELTSGPYMPPTDEEIAQREALRAECEAKFREDFARRTAEIHAEAAGKLTSLTEIRKSKKVVATPFIGQQAVSQAQQHM